MSNVMPDANKVHSLGKNELSEIIRWKELWVGSIDSDEKISVRIPNLQQVESDISNPEYDALQVRGHISLNAGDFFIRDFTDRLVMLNVAEELKTISNTLSTFTQNNDLNYIKQINEISVENTTQYNPVNNIITLYTDDINEPQNDPGLPHLWWTQDRFDAAFSLKNSTNLNDSSSLLRLSDLNFGNSESTGVIPGINPQTMKIDISLLPSNIVNDNNLSGNKDLIVGTLAERDAYQTPFEGLFWKILDNTNPSDNDMLFIYNGTTWLEIVGNTINQSDIITNINNSNTLQIDNSKNLTNFNISNINEYENINFASANNIYFSRQRLNDSIESPDNTILITKNNQNITTLSLVGYNPISSIEQIYSSLGFSFVPNHSEQYFNSTSVIPNDLNKSFNFRGDTSLNSMVGQVRRVFSGESSYISTTYSILKPLFFVDTNYISFEKKTGGSTNSFQIKEKNDSFLAISDDIRNQILNEIINF
jgi:hypothetical protein